MNMSPANKDHFESEKEAIHMILTGIGDEIYSIVDACQTTQEMREAIKRLQQGESLDIQDLEWLRFVTIVKQQHKIDEVSYHKLFDILKQYQKEDNELRAKRLARNANDRLIISTFKHKGRKEDLREGKNYCINLQGNDLLTGNRGSDLYTISLQESTSSTPLCLMAKATPTQAWLWHRKLSQINFDYINLLSKKDILIGLPKLNSKGRLNLLHMDLCGPMRVASINGKKYILVIVDDYSRYTWTLFLRSKDETPEVLKDFLTMIQRNLQAPIISVRTNRGIEFLNKTLNAFFKEEGIEHQTSTARTPEQNDVVKRRNRTLASNYDNPDLIPQRQDVSSLADTNVPSQQELDLLFGPLYDEFFNVGSNPQDKQPSVNIPSTSAPSTHTNVHAEENSNDQAKEGEQLQDNEFTNPLCASTQDVAESSSHNIGNSNVSTFNQPQISEYR
nr:hypothetical protein [Tanacetum cinerariifolium]